MSEENRSTHKLYEKEKIGEVQIADEVVAIIAGLAATEVEGRKEYEDTAPASFYSLSSFKTLINAFCGISTLPT